MIRKQDLLEAIAECQGQRNPNANTCIKLAAYYTILDHLDDEPESRNEERYFLQSYAPPSQIDMPVEEVREDGTIKYSGESEFADLISGLSQTDVWSVVDELMTTLKVLHPRLYDGVMRKLDGLR